jgi:asparagine synthase (glutamine-hydrolysing)
MPGLSGYFQFKHLNCQDHFRSSIKKLLHFPNYSAQTKFVDSVGICKINIHDQLNNNIYTRDGISIAIWGDIFGINSHNITNSIQVRNSPEEAIFKQYANRKGILDIAKNINGDFNCLIYDSTIQKLFIFNDRFGFRPLYYYIGDNAFIFSSELKSFLSYPFFSTDTDWQSVSDYLRYEYVLGDRTLYKYVSVLTPSTCLEIGINSIKQNKYWSPVYTESISLNNLDQAIDEGYELFKQSVRRRIFNTNNILVFLSGGLDSRLIAGVATQEGGNIVTSTLGAKYSYEYKLAKQVCRTLNIEMPKRFSINDKWMIDHFKNIAWQSEAQHASLGLSWMHGVVTKLGTDFDCLLNGIFGGHLSFGSPYFNKSDLITASRSNSQQVERIDRGFNGHIYNKIERYLTDDIKNVLSGYRTKTIHEEMLRVKDQSDKLYFQQDAFFLYNRIRRGMIAIDQNYIHYHDRYPFASYELFDFYLRLKPELTIDHFLYKEIYKRHLPHLAKIPWWTTGADLYSKPSKIQSRLRSLFNYADWYTRRITAGHLCLEHPWSTRYEDCIFSKNSYIRDFLLSILDSEQCLDRKIINPNATRTIYSDFSHGRISMVEIGKLVLLESWFRYF